MSRRLFISFSGGETSAFMAQWLLANRADRYDEIVCLFANTGQENEETLHFVQQCDEAFGPDVVWLEAVTHHGEKKGCTHKVVDFTTASRAGEPFEDAIRKYGIPNVNFPHCTRELKLNPMISYLRSIGWESGSYDTAIGIRVDEVDRVDANRKPKRLIYPLIEDVSMSKPGINTWWRNQPFRLDLKGYQGNCKWCWKKTLRKHLTLLEESPETFDFPERMERDYGHVGPNLIGGPRVFFRKYRSTEDLRLIATDRHIDPAFDDSKFYEWQLDLDLDTSNGCSESCEIDFSGVA